MLQRKYDSRLASAKSSSLPGLLAKEQELGRDQHPLQRGPHRRFEWVLSASFGLDDGDERRDVVVGHGPAKRPARERPEDSLGIDQGSSETTSDAIAEVVDRGRLLRRSPKIGDDFPAARFVQRTFDLDVMDRQARPFHFSPPTLLTVFAPANP